MVWAEKRFTFQKAELFDKRNKILKPGLKNLNTIKHQDLFKAKHATPDAASSRVLSPDRSGELASPILLRGF
jgi:hypothetical protein